MRGYYYDQTGPDPREPGTNTGSGRPRPRRVALRTAVLFLCALAVLTAGTVALWAAHGQIRLDLDRWSAEGAAQPAQTQSQTTVEETTVERAPTGDGTTLTIAPLPQEPAHSLQQIYEENIASIVSIRGIKQSSMNLGTGVVMSEDGYIITNSHVIEGCSAVDVVLQDDSVHHALLVGRDAQTDLAVLKIEADDLSPAQFGDSALLRVGDTVAAIGNPLGEELRGTMTDGIISAINRDVNVDGYTMALIQTTAALNSGNSGGALINDHGQVVGITNLKMQSYDNTVEGLGFAIPTATVKTVVDALIAEGVVSGRPSLGITGYTVTQAEQEQYGMPAGVCVASVEEGSDARSQGVLPGDVIVAANGERVESMEQLLAIKEQMQVGQSITLRLWRQGAYLERDVTLVEQYTLQP